MAVLGSFGTFTNEAALVGRLLAGYADLEIDLMHCANAARNDFPHVFRSMYGERGESRRIRTAERIARPLYRSLGLAGEFERAVAAVRECLKIRNHYAHSNWWDDNSGRLAIANLEQAVNGPQVCDLSGLQTRHVDVPHLVAQVSFFNYADALLVYVIQEGNARQGKPAFPNRTMPIPMALPPMTLP